MHTRITSNNTIIGYNPRHVTEYENTYHYCTNYTVCVCVLGGGGGGACQRIHILDK